MGGVLELGAGVHDMGDVVPAPCVVPGLSLAREPIPHCAVLCVEAFGRVLQEIGRISGFASHYVVVCGVEEPVDDLLASGLHVRA